jgi:GTP:adenosylcobinamide-phosphate guanylyltransferase
MLLATRVAPAFLGETRLFPAVADLKEALHLLGPVLLVAADRALVDHRLVHLRDRLGHAASA